MNDGVLNVITTVCGFGALTMLSKLIPPVLICGFFFSMLKVKATSALVNGLPSDHVTPLRRWKVRVLLSLDHAHDLASHG